MASIIDFLKKGSDYVYPKTLITAVYELSTGNTLDTVLAGKLGVNATAAAATKLATARSINGTSFNGTADITTTKWGTARTITIGAKGKSVDGSAAVSWTLSEIGAAASSHKHVAADITDNIPASKISGVLSIDNIPQGALERLVVVADQTAMLALTANDVQVGDTVKLTSTGLMYFVKDASKLGTSGAFEVYTAGAASSVPWSGITGKPSTYTPSEHTHLYAGSATAGGSATSAVKLNTARTLTIGSSGKTFDGTADVSWSLSEIGAAAINHGTHVTFGTAAPKVAGTAAVGTATTVSRSDHVHPAQTSVSGNAGSATKLATARSINGTSFNGTADITTANWGTARDITIGDATKSVNGSAAVTWTLAEIGCIAAAGLAITVDDTNIPKTIA